MKTRWSIPAPAAASMAARCCQIRRPMASVLIRTIRVAPGKRLGQRCRVVEVTVADVGTTRAELVQSLRMARDEDEVLWRDALQQLLGDKAA